MDFFVILETFGLPIFLVLVLGWYVSRQNKFIQQDLTKEIESLKLIIIKLIDNAKKNELSLEQIKGRLTTIVNIFKEK